MSTKPPLATLTQIRRGLNSLANVSAFSRRHRIPIRTIWRLRKRGANPTPQTIDKVARALIKFGVNLYGDEKKQ